MPDSPFIIDITPANAQKVIVDDSFNIPVLIDFWADWCQPCKTLMPILEKLANEYAGKFILAKVNTEEYQELSTQLGIKSLPTVKLFKDGQPIDEFSGAIPEAEVRAFLDKHIAPPVTEIDTNIETAQQLIDSGEPDAAVTLLQEALAEDVDNVDLSIMLAQAFATMNKNTEAKAILENLSDENQDNDEVKLLINQLHFDDLAANSESEEELLTRLASDPDDKGALEQLATYYAAKQEYEQALGLLLKLMQKDRAFEDGIAQKSMIKLFDILGADPLVKTYRNKMLNLIY